MEKTICYECGKVIAETKCPNCTGQSMCLECGKRLLGVELVEKIFREDE